MKLFTLTLICLSFVLAPLYSGEGGGEKFDKVEMDINRDNYILFENESLILCDRGNDEYLMEISREIELYVRSQKVSISEYQRELIEDYYVAQHILFTKRNKIGARGIRIGVKGAKLAAKAVSGAFMLIASGFDKREEMEFEEEMEREAEKIEREAEKIEEDAEDYEDQVYVINKLERKIRREIEILDEFDLSVDEDLNNFSIEIDDND